MDAREQFLSTVAEMHSAQDGVTVGILSGLIVTESPLLPILAVGLGFGAQRLSRRQLAIKVPTLLRTSQIRSNPEYFLVGAVTAFIGTVLASMHLP